MMSRNNSLQCRTDCTVFGMRPWMVVVRGTLRWRAWVLVIWNLQALVSENW